jgi:hypothetical protein
MFTLLTDDAGSSLVPEDPPTAGAARTQLDQFAGVFVHNNSLQPGDLDFHIAETEPDPCLGAATFHPPFDEMNDLTRLPAAGGHQPLDLNAHIQLPLIARTPIY